MSDLIERQKAIEALDFEIVHMTAYRNGKNEGNPMAQYNKGLEDGIKAIRALPSAEPEPKKGKWIDYPDCLQYKGAYADDQIVCSACHHVFSIMDNCTEEFDFCPNCGADMRGENGKA